jgi:hypothetical protein
MVAAGEEDVADVATTRYDGSLDAAGLVQAAEAGDDGAAGAVGGGELFEGDAVGAVSLSLWVGVDGLIHRVRLSYSGSAGALLGDDTQTGTVSVESTTELSSIGEDVAIDIPEVLATGPDDVEDDERFEPIGEPVG